MSNYPKILQMLEIVADHLGEELLAKMAFVGGCTTGLLITDALVLEQIRATDDVDVIVEVLGHGDYARLQQQLRARGFRESSEDEVVCRWRLGSLIVDIMPTDERILGFSNRWYPAALASAQWYQLSVSRRIRVVTPVYFLATKIDAFQHRGHQDFLASRDMEDILSLIDGRENLCDEVMVARDDVRLAMAEAMMGFLRASDFEYAVQSIAQDFQREKGLFKRLDRLADKFEWQ